MEELPPTKEYRKNTRDPGVLEGTRGRTPEIQVFREGTQGGARGYKVSQLSKTGKSGRDSVLSVPVGSTGNPPKWVPGARRVAKPAAN